MPTPSSPPSCEIVDGSYTGEIDYYAYAENKALAMQRAGRGARATTWRSSYAYSDSITDLHMLEVVGHPYAVNPDKELRKEANATRLAGARLHPPVALRSRHAAAAEHSRTLAAIALGTAAAVGGAVYVVARRRVTRG